MLINPFLPKVMLVMVLYFRSRTLNKAHIYTNAHINTCTYMHTSAYTHAHTCILLHIHIHAYAHIHVYTYIHIHTFICMHTYMPICICIYYIHKNDEYTDICLHTHIYVCMHSYIHAHMHRYICIHIIPHVHTYAYTFKQAHILTHMHAHVRTDAFMVCRFPFNFLSWKLNPQSHMLMVLKSRTCGKPRAFKWLISHVLVHGGRGHYKEKAFWNI